MSIPIHSSWLNNPPPTWDYLEPIICQLIMEQQFFKRLIIPLSLSRCETASLSLFQLWLPCSSNKIHFVTSIISSTLLLQPGRAVVFFRSEVEEGRGESQYYFNGFCLTNFIYVMGSRFFENLAVYSVSQFANRVEETKTGVSKRSFSNFYLK